MRRLQFETLKLNNLWKNSKTFFLGYYKSPGTPFLVLVLLLQQLPSFSRSRLALPGEEHQSMVSTRSIKMSKILFTTRVVGVNEEQRALVTSITRFLGKPIEPDDLFRLAAAYQSLIRQGAKVKAHQRNNDNFSFDRDLYEYQKKNFKNLLSELQTKYTTQFSIQFEDYTTSVP